MQTEKQRSSSGVMRRDATGALSVASPVRPTHGEQRTWGREHDAHAPLVGRGHANGRNLCVVGAVPPRILLDERDGAHEEAPILRAEGAADLDYSCRGICFVNCRVM